MKTLRSFVFMLVFFTYKGISDMYTNSLPNTGMSTVLDSLVVTVGRMKDDLNMLRKNMQRENQCECKQSHNISESGNTDDVNNKTVNDGGNDNDTLTGSYWMPSPQDTFQIVLSSNYVKETNTTSVYEVDLFDFNEIDFQKIKQSGRKIVCYFSGGTYENWRPDAKHFPSSVIGKNLAGWPGEKYLDVRSDVVRGIMKSRLDKAVTRGCDAVDPDDLDAYSNDNGLHLSANDQLDYNKFLSVEAHLRGMSIGLKNDLSQIKDLIHYFDFAINEQCCKYHECSLYQPFIAAGKAVFHIEYADHVSDDQQLQHRKKAICNSCAIPNGFTTIIKKADLDEWRMTCG